MVARRARSGVAGAEGGLLLDVGVYLTGIYGGYFGAAQGVILIALLAILIDDDLQRLNGLKNVIAAVINAVAAILFIVFAPVAWLRRSCSRSGRRRRSARGASSVADCRRSPCASPSSSSG